METFALHFVYCILLLLCENTCRYGMDPWVPVLHCLLCLLCWFYSFVLWFDSVVRLYQPSNLFKSTKDHGMNIPWHMEPDRSCIVAELDRPWIAPMLDRYSTKTSILRNWTKASIIKISINRPSARQKVQEIRRNKIQVSYPMYKNGRKSKPSDTPRRATSEARLN